MCDYTYITSLIYISDGTVIHHKCTHKNAVVHKVDLDNLGHCLIRTKCQEQKKKTWLSLLLIIMAAAF